jgi:uncharacterized repeat protein (TIGR01451 family)
MVTGGDTLRYDVSVENQGPTDAFGVEVVDLMPTDLQGVTWICTPSAGASCTASGVRDVIDLVDLPAGASVSYAIEGLVVTDSLSIDNTAEARLALPSTDPNEADNTDSVTVLTCEGPGEMTLANLEIDTTEIFAARDVLRTGAAVRVLAGGDATLRSCGAVVLGDGFSVESGGKLTVQVK